MAPSMKVIVSSLLVAVASALPQPQWQSSSNAPTVTTQWWTPAASATASEWDWRAWSASQAASLSSEESTATVQAVQTTSSVPYSNPFTIYTTMTNSEGVITGMPAVVTSQPTQPVVATVCSGCASVASAQSSFSSMVASMYTTSTSQSSSSQAASSTSSSASATVTFQQSTGAAAKTNVAGGSFVLALFGAIVAVL